MQNNHPLIYQLSKLKESSKEAIADAHLSIEDTLKRYLHVERQVEKDLKHIIIKAAALEKGCLILVCGNVGDGKSHLLSKLSQDVAMAQVLSDFKIHNDATESFSPDQNCNETLKIILAPYSDACIAEVTDKWILAINLGTLSNFLEENADDFSKLTAFVDEHGIINPEKFEEREDFITDSDFQYINFTNHHFFDLTRDGVKPDLVEKLLEKVVSPVPANPIFIAYQQLKNEEWSLNCPVRVNFEFLGLEANRKVVARLLVECILKEKLIISFRQVLNFIHDILVPYELGSLNIEQYRQAVLGCSVQHRLEYHIVNYIFERPKISKIFSSIFRLDPAIRRYEILDARAISLFTSNDPLLIFTNDFPDISSNLKINLGAELTDQNILFKIYLRLRYFNENHHPLYHDDHFSSFVKSLYYANTKDAAGLKEINELVKNAVTLWNGSTVERNKIMFNNISKHSSYRLFRNIQLKSNLPNKADKIDKEVLHQFLTEVKVQFLIPAPGDSYRNRPISIDVDYSLFLLLQKVKVGYRPNKLDRNSFINFVTLVDNLIYDQSEDEELFIDEVNMGNHLDFKLQLDEYGDFKFSKI